MRFLGNIFNYYSKFHPFVLSDLTPRKTGHGILFGGKLPNGLFQGWLSPMI